MSRRKHTIAILALCLVAAPLAAARALQDVASDTVRVVPAVAAPVTIAIGVVAGEPALTSAITPAGVTRRMTTADLDAKSTLPASSAFIEGGRNPAMIIVGSAALLVGAVVGGKGGTIIMIGGGVLGLVGLWNYLQ